MKIFASSLLLVLLLAQAAWSIQRIIVEKATNKVVDAGSNSLQYDPRFYDNLDYPDNTIPAGENPRKYLKDGAGNIVKAPANDLRERFHDEWRSDMIARVTASGLAQGLKDFLIELINRLER